MSALNAAAAFSRPYDLLLSRLDGVQASGKGHRARCPCCRGHSRKLSLACGDDGRVLVHCFAGCSALDVLQSIGLTAADLFERSIASKMTPAERHELRERKRHSDWRAALEVLAHESTVLLLALHDDYDQGLTLEELKRTDLAVRRIADARAVLR